MTNKAVRTIRTGKFEWRNRGGRQRAIPLIENQSLKKHETTIASLSMLKSNINAKKTHDHKNATSTLLGLYLHLYQNTGSRKTLCRNGWFDGNVSPPARGLFRDWKCAAWHWDYRFLSPFKNGNETQRITPHSLRVVKHDIKAIIQEYVYWKRTIIFSTKIKFDGISHDCQPFKPMLRKPNRKKIKSGRISNRA